MSDQKRKKQSSSTRSSSNAQRVQQAKSTSSSSSALSHGDDGNENCSDASRAKKYSSAKPCRRTCSNVDSIKKIVQEEGRIARNLITWNVPLENSDRSSKSTSSKPSGPSSPLKKVASQPQSPTARVYHQKPKDNDHSKASIKKSNDSSKNAAKSQTNVAGKKDIRARYWAYLFENLHRAVDEIYQTCEADESVVECKEVIMMLDQYRRDFHSLIERLLMMQDYEKADKGSRRKNLAWEVRKRSPSKSFMMSYRRDAFSPASRQAGCSLTFTNSADSALDLSASLNGSTDLIIHTNGEISNKNNNTDGNEGEECNEGKPNSTSALIGQVSSSANAPESKVTSLRSDALDDITSGQSIRETLTCTSSTLSTWADRVRSLSSVPLTNQKLPVSKIVPEPSHPSKVTHNPLKSHIEESTETVHYNATGSKNGITLNDTTSNNSNNLPVLGQTLSGSLINFSDPSVLDRDQEGWETVQRGGKQRQKASLWSTGEITLDRTHQSSFSSKSLHLIPSAAANEQHGASQEVQLSSSSPFLFTQSRHRDVTPHKIAFRPPAQQTFEGVPLSIDTSVFSYNNTNDDNNTNNIFQQQKSHILTTTDFFSNAAEPNSKAIFASHYKSTGVASRQEIPRQGLEMELKEENDDASPEFDDEELNKALINVLKEEDNLDDLLEEESEAALESAMQEEKTYLQEIEREEREGGESNEDANNNQENSPLQKSWDWEYIIRKYEEDKASRKGETWGEIMDDAEVRTPGRLVHVFEKLSSPSRKRSTIESRKQLDEKQAKAAELREKTLQERGENLRMLRKKVEEIQSLKLDLMNQKRLRMEKKLQRAEEKRQILLQMKVKKAHEEDTKASEIAFINTLEAQNKRHEIMSKHQESEARLQDMQDERQRKHEEKAAKEAAAEERRKTLEAERMSRLQEMQDRRKQRETDFEQRQQEKEKERVEAARARDREREERLAALNKQQQAHIEELQKKIQQKQDETDRRHKEKLEAIQEKAFKMSLQHHSTEDHNDDPPKLAPYEKKKICSACNVLIPSEVYLLSHLRGKMHQQAIRDSSQCTPPSQQDIEKFNLHHISDAPSDRPDPRDVCEKERHKAFKKRCKKLKLRMVQRGNEYEAGVASKTQSLVSQHKNKLQKIIKDLQKSIGMQSSGPWAQNRVSTLDRCLGEMSRIFEKNVPVDKIAFKSLGGVTVLFQLFEVVGHPSTTDLPPLIPTKSLLLISSVLKLLCLGCNEVCQYLLLSNRICILIDLISQHLNELIPDDFSSEQVGSQCKLLYDQFVSSLIELLAAVLFLFSSDSKIKLSSNNKNTESKKDGYSACMLQAYDVVSYIISIGILDKISVYFNNIRGSIDGDASGAEFLQNYLILVTSLIGISSTEEYLVLETKKLDDPTQIILTLKVTQLVGIVSLMYGILLHSDAPARGNNPPPNLPKHTLDVTFLGFRMLNQVACLNLAMFQSSLGEEGTSLEFRHIASYLLWYCNHLSNDILLHEVILCIGYFSLLNSDNQLIIQSGQPPTILQQLCSLPFQYFSDPKLTCILFPTLICCCFKMMSNKTILEQELSCVLLSNFLEENSLKDQQAQQGNIETSTTVSSVSKFKQSHVSPVSRRMCLAARFPKHLWQEAQSYFSSTD